MGPALFGIVFLLCVHQTVCGQKSSQGTTQLGPLLIRTVSVVLGGQGAEPTASLGICPALPGSADNSQEMSAGWWPG